ncbi:MAG: redoxin domain-containing protein [Candidatus Kapabacteria bacterium]|nr:redoxin domain-containing protein [Candidatus Kapabacteria bacterium]
MKLCRAALAAITVITTLAAALILTASSALVGKQAYGFTVEDQFKKEWSWETFKGKPVVIVLADRAGREYSEKWVQPLRSSLGAKVEYVAFADVSSVPGLLKGFIRGKIRDSYQHPLLLDWEGDVFKYYECRDGVANVVFIDKNNTVRYTASGKGESAEVDVAVKEISRYLGN